MDRRSLRYACPPFLLLSLFALGGCAVDGDDPAGPQLGGDDCVAVTPTAGVYAGPFYDTHAHADLSSAPASLDCLADRHDIRTIVLFAGQTGGLNAAGRVRRWMSPYAPRFVPFVHLDPKSVADVNVAELDVAVASTPQIRGVGELALYRQPWVGTSFQDAPWSSLLAWAAQKDLWLMVHPRGDQMAELDALLAAHPHTKVLVHTPWSPVEIPHLLQKHPGMHFTLDLATLISVEQAGGGVDVLMSPVTGGRDDFIRRYDAERDAILADSYERWAPTVLAAPTRVMWGTDMFDSWHFEPEVADRLMDFARRWVALLPADVRADFAHRNADRLLGAGPRF